jgi:hypothetical protein
MSITEREFPKFGSLTYTFKSGNCFFSIRQLTLLFLFVEELYVILEIFHYKSISVYETFPLFTLAVQGITLIWLWLAPRYFLPLNEDEEEKSLGNKKSFHSSVNDAQFKAHVTKKQRRRRDVR